MNGDDITATLHIQWINNFLCFDFNNRLSQNKTKNWNETKIVYKLICAILTCKFIYFQNSAIVC